MALNSQLNDSAPVAAPVRGRGLLGNGLISLLVRALFSLALVLFLITRINLAEAWATIRGANFALLGLDFLIYLGAIALGNWKWQILCRAQGIKASYWTLLNYTFVGLFFGNFLPTNVGGDVVRAFDLARSSGRAEAASISVLVDRIIGLLVFVGSAALMSLIALLVIRDHPEITTIALLSTVIFAGILALMAGMLSRRLSRRAAFLFRLVPQLGFLRATAERVYAALQVYRHARSALLWAAAISLAIQFVTTLVNYLITVSLGLDIPFIYIFLFNPLIAFVLLVPISINGIGWKESAYVFFFTTVAGLVAAPQSLSFSVVMHLIVILSGVLGGLFWLPRRRQTVPVETPAIET